MNIFKPRILPYSKDKMPWTLSELDFMLTSRPHKSFEWIAKWLGRTKQATYKKFELFDAKLAYYFAATGNEWQTLEDIQDGLKDPFTPSTLNNLARLGYLQRRGNPDASQYRYSPERLEAKYIIEPDNLQHDRIAWLDSLIMAMPESDLSHVYRTEIEARKERILNA